MRRAQLSAVVPHPWFLLTAGHSPVAVDIVLLTHTSIRRKIRSLIIADKTRCGGLPEDIPFHCPMSSSFLMDAESVVHAFLHGRLCREDCETLRRFYCSCLVGYSWILLYSDWLFRHVPAISFVYSITLFFLHGIHLFLTSIGYFMQLLLVDYFRLKSRKNYKRLKRLVFLPKTIMGTIWSGYANKNEIGANKKVREGVNSTL